ncbi:Hypothetical predicted protein [Octopus vulgaris]|uniref:Uncharacterized protein n=1 Tax=Octopus vulgaris TaxID=6645 RepID=A0AA36B329_OCTVU|nr:Hypothetical predicted protein [Octopus vulgaris]
MEIIMNNDALFPALLAKMAAICKETTSKNEAENIQDKKMRSQADFEATDSLIHSDYVLTIGLAAIPNSDMNLVVVIVFVHICNEKGI